MLVSALGETSDRASMFSKYSVLDAGTGIVNVSKTTSIPSTTSTNGGAGQRQNRSRQGRSRHGG